MAGVAPVNLYHALRHRRRQGWLYSLLCLLVASGVGIVLGTVITPLLLLVVGLAFKFAAWLGAPEVLTSAAIGAIRGWARYHLGDLEFASNVIDQVRSIRDLPLFFPIVGRLLAVAVPTMLFGALVWLRLRAVILRASGGDLIAALAARAPRADDPGERRLGNSLETAAIAAGIPAPGLYLIDDAAVNAGVIGHSINNVSVLVTRGLLDKLAPPEAEAVMGRLVAAICAGDHDVAQSVDATLQSYGLLVTLIDLPLRQGAAWRTLRDYLSVCLLPVASSKALAGVANAIDDSIEGKGQVDLNVPRQGFFTYALLPFIVISSLFKAVLFLWTSLFLTPPLRLVWRSRRAWTDATAARRNLDPQELVSALGKLTGVPAGAGTRAYLFLGSAGYRQGGGARVAALNASSSSLAGLELIRN